jgi:hypothetical protein
MSASKLRATVHQKHMRLMAEFAIRGAIAEAAKEYLDALSAFRIATFSANLPPCSIVSVRRAAPSPLLSAGLVQP